MGGRGVRSLVFVKMGLRCFRNMWVVIFRSFGVMIYEYGRRWGDMEGIGSWLVFLGRVCKLKDRVVRGV